MPNYIGDAVMAWPAVQRLRDSGHEVHLLGKPWLHDLAGHTGVAVTSYPASFRARVGLLRQIAAHEGSAHLVLFTHSFSSALEARIAGLKAVGYRKDGRSWLLHRSFRYKPHLHLVQSYWELSERMLGSDAPVPDRVRLYPAAGALHAVEERLRHAGIHQPFVLLCPLAGGQHRGQGKDWPGFAVLAHALSERSLQVVYAPGPGGEAEQLRANFAVGHVLEGLSLGELGALASKAECVVANDGGQGHVSAAAGARLISIFGGTDPAKVGPWSPDVRIVKESHGWPDACKVLDACMDWIKRSKNGHPLAGDASRLQSA